MLLSNWVSAVSLAPRVGIFAAVPTRDVYLDKSTPSLESVYKTVREVVPPIEDDRVFYLDIQEILNLIEKNSIIKEIENYTGELK